jgi:HNH endonuclease
MENNILTQEQRDRLGWHIAGRIIVREDGCWFYKGKSNANGYPTSVAREAHTTTHRIVWMRLVGPIPEGYVLDHLCRVPACINPAHHEAVTYSENFRRGDGARGTTFECGHLVTPENSYHHRRAYTTNDIECRTCVRQRAGAHYYKTRKLTGKPNAQQLRAAKTHCPKGHPYSPENTYIHHNKDGSFRGRRCRTCTLENNRNGTQRRSSNHA